MTTSNEYLVFGAPDIHCAEIAEVVAAMASGWIGTGPRVHQFEAALARYKDTPVERVAAVSSCTAALHLSLLVAGIGAGDEVITSALTFCATANAVIHSGATPVLADVDPVTMNLDIADVERRLSSRTRAVIPVHFAGRPCDMDRLAALAGERGLTIIEDCAHAVEAEYRTRPVGTLGDFGCFSFYATKNLTCGEGGMVIAKSERHIERIKRLALHGLSHDAWNRFGDEGYKHYRVTECGYKYNMMDLQAAIGLHQLERLEAGWLRRRRLWQRYREGLAELPLLLPAEPEPETRHALHLFTVQVDPERCRTSRDELLAGLHGKGIGAGVHYVSLPEHPYYRQRFGWRVADCPVAGRIGRRTLSLPLSPKVSDAEQERVIAALHELCRAT